MENFGKIFKKFRESRGLKLKDFVDSGLSTSQLSRFEKGESDLTITKFMMALNELNMPIDEFMYAVNDFHRDELNEILEQVRMFVIHNDVQGMRSLLISQIEKKSKPENFHKLNIILIKIRLQDLSGEVYYTDEELNYLSDYLFSVDYWGCYELLLFMNTLDVFNHEMFMVLSKEMNRRSDFYKEIPNHRRLISTMLLNGYITCIEREEFIDAKYFEKQLNSCFFIEAEMHERLVFLYARNLYKLKKDNDRRAIIELRKCIGMMKLLSCNHMADTFEKYLEKVLNKK
ncbi:MULTISPECIES: helix-turn-helix domain-containing protein [Streptococcus]|uniref:helix-turn-helix domain-containing protein n=1 Tax=Streptococcus TaxID=1301 RepID=UPI0008E22C20|nr:MULTISPECIES: Rgg/GadR/MutR family transcriptional regulator [Streptococcus]SFQ68786.1 transcriptional activator, Rgg/GadR/MutR family, C-terminal domain-containing protein [Streptococcus equinus]HHU65887.1 Rgg/GadR/MutR family transcriptional regulator [Streptococcus sp.]